MLISRIAKNS